MKGVTIVVHELTPKLELLFQLGVIGRQRDAAIGGLSQKHGVTLDEFEPSQDFLGQNDANRISDLS